MLLITPTAVSHRLWYIILPFSFSSKYFLIFCLTSFWFMGHLGVCYLVSKYLGFSWDLSLISNTIPSVRSSLGLGLAFSSKQSEHLHCMWLVVTVKSLILIFVFCLSHLFFVLFPLLHVLHILFQSNRILQYQFFILKKHLHLLQFFHLLIHEHE